MIVIEGSDEALGQASGGAGCQCTGLVIADDAVETTEEVRVSGPLVQECLGRCCGQFALSSLFCIATDPFVQLTPDFLWRRQHTQVIFIIK